MRLSFIARKNLAAKPLQTALSAILLAFGVGMVSLMMLSEKQIKDQFERNIKDIDLVLGAKGSPLQLILANVYHIDAPTGNISLEAANEVIKHPYIESGIPLAYGDNYMGYRIVGTEYSYPEHYSVSLQEGAMWEETFEVTIGANVAKSTGLGVGDTFFSAHGLTDGTDVHDDKTFTVVGILAPSSSVIDQLMLTGIESIWGVHGQHADEPKEITAVLLKKRNPMAVLTLPNMLRETNMQVALPAIEINRLNQQFGIGASTLRAIAMLIMALSFASIFISVFENMQARRYELALMRTMGGTPSTLYKLLLLEGGLLSLGGVIIGLIISRIGLLTLAMVVEDKFRYDLADMSLLTSEISLGLGAIFVGLLAAALPAFKTLRMDISKTLSNE
jgi:putative ABC transport system permease protein